MTGFMHEKEFSRKTFLKGGGALIVGFSLAGAGVVGKASAAQSPYASNGPFDQNQIDSWITINADNTASILTGAMFRGTGSETGLMMIAAEELGIGLDQALFVSSDTNLVPNTGSKGASNTITHAGTAIRTAAAYANQALLNLASGQLGVPVAQLSVSKGVVSGGGKSITYGQLLGGKLFNVAMPGSLNLQNASARIDFGLAPGVSPAKPVSQYTLVGTRAPRIEIPAIVTGTYTFVQNIKVPGMMHGRVVRPLGQAVYGFGAPVLSVDESSIAHLPGVRVVRNNNFLGVVAPHEYDAIQAAAQIKVTWADPPAVLPGNASQFEGMRALDSAGKTIQTPVSWYLQNPNHGDVNQGLASAAHTVSQTYAWPAHIHNPMGPNCCVADVTPQGSRIFASTQDAYGTRTAVSSALGVPLNSVRVTTPATGGSFGTPTDNDANVAAALMSQAVGKPVRVQFMRWDEIGWAYTSPGSLMDIRAGMDAKGNMTAFDFVHFYPQYTSGPVTNAELAGAPLATPSSSITGNFFPHRMYSVVDANNPNTSNGNLTKSIPLQSQWIRGAFMRAGSSPGVLFGGEQVVDELAHAAGMDPVAFRLQNVTQAPAENRDLLAVMNAVTQAANYKPKVAGSNLSSADIVTGRGVAWSNVYRSSLNAAYEDAPYGWTAIAAIADIEVNKKTGKVTPKHIYAAATVGLAVNPGLVENQIVGGLVQVTGRLLVEEYRFNKQHVTSTDFVTYPILRFRDSPMVTPIVVQQADLRTKGVGEPVSVPSAAAIANAFFDATGVRMRTAPFTPVRVRDALKAAGVA
jgi:CO/xanthine dehydrogenase Mo-binding subunit